MKVRAQKILKKGSRFILKESTSFRELIKLGLESKDIITLHMELPHTTGCGVFNYSVIPLFDPPPGLSDTLLSSDILSFRYQNNISHPITDKRMIKKVFLDSVIKINLKLFGFLPGDIVRVCNTGRSSRKAPYIYFLLLGYDNDNNAWECEVLKRDTDLPDSEREELKAVARELFLKRKKLIAQDYFDYRDCIYFLKLKDTLLNPSQIKEFVRENYKIDFHDYLKIMRGLR